MNLTKKQLVPTAVKNMLKQINDTKVNFAVLELSPDPKFPTLIRTLIVEDMLAYSTTKEIHFFFKIEFRNTEGDLMPIDTQSIENWKVHSTDENPILGADGNLILVDEQTIEVNDEGEETIIKTEKVAVNVNTYTYMTWLLKNKKADLHTLISSYAMRRASEGKFNL